MKKILLLLLLIVSIAAHAQVVLTGYVFDEPEKKPLEGAYVYLDGTTFSVSTDEAGRFRLVLPQRYNVPLVVSFIGFETIRLDNPYQYEGKNIKVYLREDAAMLDEVVINPRFTRKQMLAAFRKEFLGRSKAGRSCSIENEDDIYLFYDEQQHVLKAKCRVPLRINNEILQYRVLFELAAFEARYTTTSLSDEHLLGSFYAGSTSFTDTSVKGAADKRRRSSFAGSLTHLMRAIKEGNWEKHRFSLYLDKFPVDPAQYFATADSLGMKKVVLNKKKLAEHVPKVTMSLGEQIPAYRRLDFVILYDQDSNRQSALRFLRDTFFIDGQGLFVPLDAFNVSGHMGGLKAGDMLPTDYEYTPDVIDNLKTSVKG